MSGNTGLTEATVLTASWFEELAGTAVVTRMKKNTIVGIPLHLCLVIFSRDEGLGDHTLVEEKIRKNNSPWDPELVNACHSGPGCRKKEALAYRKQGYKESLACQISGSYLWKIVCSRN